MRSTFASRSLSQRSFTVQPAPLSSKAPVPKRASSLTSGNAPGGAASAMDQKHGQASNHVPARMPLEDGAPALHMLGVQETKAGAACTGALDLRALSITLLDHHVLPAALCKRILENMTWRVTLLVTKVHLWEHASVSALHMVRRSQVGCPPSCWEQRASL